MANPGGQGLDVGIARLALLGVDDLHLLPSGFLAGIALGPVAVEDQHHADTLESGVIPQYFDKPGPGQAQIDLRHFIQLRPVEEHVVAVHDQKLLLGRCDWHFVRSRLVSGRCVLPPLGGAEFPLHDFLQLPVIQRQIPGDDLGLFGLFQHGGDVHILRDLVPLDGEARAVGAEDGVGTM